MQLLRPKWLAFFLRYVHKRHLARQSRNFWLTCLICSMRPLASDFAVVVVSTEADMPEGECPVLYNHFVSRAK